MALADFAIRNAKPGSKPQKLSDGGNLHLLVTPAGGKLWRFNYRFLGKQKTASLGPYPEASLAMARERLLETKKLLAMRSVATMICWILCEGILKARDAGVLEVHVDGMPELVSALNA